MKIVLVFSYGVSLKSWHNMGLFDREVKLYVELSKYHDITFLTYGDETDLQFQSKLGSISVIPIYTLFPKSKSKFLRLLSSFFYAFMLRSSLRNFDVIKTNQMWGSWLAVSLKFLTGSKLLLRCGYEQYSFALKSGKGIFFRVFLYVLSKISYIYADRVHVATKSDKFFVEKTFLSNSEKIFIYPNWIDVDLFKPLSQSKKFSDRILFLGRLNPQKNIHLLIDALQNTGLSLDVFGAGELKNELKTYARGKNVVVNFLGNVSNDKLPQIFSSYSLFVLPSHYEGNPKALLEAMSCGMAVIGTNVPGIKEIIVDGETGILVEPSSIQLKDVIFSLIRNPDMVVKLGSNARDAIIRNNSFSVILEKELQAFKALLDGEAKF